MIDPIEKHFELTEVQIGLLIGLAFTLLFAIGGVVLGCLVDRYSRRLIIFCGTIVWSLCCIGCGFATSFRWLFIARMGVGIGEAALVPAAYAFLSDTFSSRRLATAMGVFSFGATLGIALSLGLGGLMLGLFSASDHGHLSMGRLEPWQAAFVLAGTPGLLLGLLVFTLPERPRLKGVLEQPSGASALVNLFRTCPKVMVAQFVGFSMNSLMGYTLMAWSPSFLARTFGWHAAQVGPTLGLVFGISGAVATIGSGVLADRLWARGVSGSHYLMAALALAVAAPFGAVAFLTKAPPLFLIGVTVIYFASALSLNMGATSLQLLTPPPLRGRLSGLYLLCTNMVGAGVWPLLVATMTEHLLHDRSKLGLAMAVVIPGAAVVGAAVLAFAGRDFFKVIAKSLEERSDAEAGGIPPTVRAWTHTSAPQQRDRLHGPSRLCE